MQHGSFFECRDQTEKPPPPPSIVCVFHSLVCLTAFRQQIPARRERRTPRCPARRTSPRSTSGRSRSWRWRWRKVSVCVIEEASKMKQQTDHRFSLFQPFCVFAIFRALSFFSLPVLLHLPVSVTISLSRSLSFPLKSPRAAFSGACAHARCVTPSLLVRLRRTSSSSPSGVMFQTALIPVSSRLCPGQSLHTSTSGGTLQVKKVQKNFKNNYASVECGAKILSANSEAKVRNTHTHS